MKSGETTWYEGTLLGRQSRGELSDDSVLVIDVNMLILSSLGEIRDFPWTTVIG